MSEAAVDISQCFRRDILALFYSGSEIPGLPSQMDWGGLFSAPYLDWFPEVSGDTLLNARVGALFLILTALHDYGEGFVAPQWMQDKGERLVGFLKSLTVNDSIESSLTEELKSVSRQYKLMFTDEFSADKSSSVNVTDLVLSPYFKRLRGVLLAQIDTEPSFLETVQYKPINEYSKVDIEDLTPVMINDVIYRDLIFNIHSIAANTNVCFYSSVFPYEQALGERYADLTETQIYAALLLVIQLEGLKQSGLPLSLSRLRYIESVASHYSSASGINLEVIVRLRNLVEDFGSENPSAINRINSSITSIQLLRSVGLPLVESVLIKLFPPPTSYVSTD